MREQDQGKRDEHIFFLISNKHFSNSLHGRDNEYSYIKSVFNKKIIRP